MPKARMLSITHVFRVARNLCGMNGRLGLRTLPEQDCVFEELRGTQNMCPAWSDVRQRGVSASGAVLRMHDYRTHTQGRVGLGLGDRDDWKGPQRCASRQVSVAIRSGKRGEEAGSNPQRVFGTRSQAFGMPAWKLVLSSPGNGEPWERTLSGRI